MKYKLMELTNHGISSWSSPKMMINRKEMPQCFLNLDGLDEVTEVLLFAKLQ